MRRQHDMQYFLAVVREGTISAAAEALHVAQPSLSRQMKELDNGLIDFAVIFSDFDRTLYQSITLPAEDGFGLLMPRDCKLAEKDELQISDLKDQPIIISRAAAPYLSGSPEWSDLRVVATYNLLYNASLLVEDRLGYALCFDRLINTGGDSKLCVRPIVPKTVNAGNLIWKKYQIFSPAVKAFIEQVQFEIACKHDGLRQ